MAVEPAEGGGHTAQEPGAPAGHSPGMWGGRTGPKRLWSQPVTDKPAPSQLSAQGPPPGHGRTPSWAGSTAPVRPPQVGTLVTGLWSPLVDTDRGSGTGSELEVSQHARGLRRLSGLSLSTTCSRPGLFGLNTSAWLLRTYYVWRCVIWGVRRRGLPRGRCCTGHGSQSSVQRQRERPRGPRGG